MSRQSSGYHSNRKDRRDNNQQKHFGIESWYGTGECHPGFNKSSAGDFGSAPKRIRSNDRYYQRSQSTEERQDASYDPYTDFSTDAEREDRMDKSRGQSYSRDQQPKDYDKSYHPYSQSRSFSQSDPNVLRQHHSSKFVSPQSKERHQELYYHQKPGGSYSKVEAWKSTDESVNTFRDDALNPPEHHAALSQWSRRSHQPGDRTEEYSGQMLGRSRDSFHSRNQQHYTYDKDTGLYGSYKEANMPVPGTFGSMHRKTTAQRDDVVVAHRDYQSRVLGQQTEKATDYSFDSLKQHHTSVDIGKSAVIRDIVESKAGQSQSPRKSYGTRMIDVGSHVMEEQKGGSLYYSVAGTGAKETEKAVSMETLPNSPKSVGVLKKGLETFKGDPVDLLTPAEQKSLLVEKNGSLKQNLSSNMERVNSDEEKKDVCAVMKENLQAEPLEAKISDDKQEDDPKKLLSITSTEEEDSAASKKKESLEISVQGAESKSDRVETEEEIVSKLDKMDKDILECEQNVNELEEIELQIEKDIEQLEDEIKKKEIADIPEEKAEIKTEGTRDELMDYFVAKFTPRDTELVTKIYKENKARARLANASLTNLNSGIMHSLKPLYNQPSDLPFYYENIRRHKQFRKKLVNFLRNKKLAIFRAEETMKQQLMKQKELWLKKLEKIENNVKRRAKLTKVRAFYEREFPEIKRQREQQERMTRLGSRSSWGAFARSEAEFEEIIDNLTELEATEKHMHQLAVHPPNLLHKFERRVQYGNTNGLIKDVEAFEKSRKIGNVWTGEERRKFKEKFTQHPKDFGKIATFLPKKCVSDCVLYYYQNKKREHFKVSLKKASKKTGRLQRQLVSTLTYAQPIPHIQIEQQPVKTRQKEREREREREKDKPKELDNIEKETEAVETQNEAADIQPPMPTTDNEASVVVPEQPMILEAASVPVSQDEPRQSVDELIAKYLAKKPLLAEMVDPSRWSEIEISKAVEGLKRYGRNWSAIAKLVSTKSEAQCKNFYFNYKRKFHLESILGIAKQVRRSSQLAICGSPQTFLDVNETKLRDMRSHKALRESIDIPSVSAASNDGLQVDDVDMAAEKSDNDDEDAPEAGVKSHTTVPDSQSKQSVSQGVAIDRVTKSDLDISTNEKAEQQKLIGSDNLSQSIELDAGLETSKTNDAAKEQDKDANIDVKKSTVSAVVTSSRDAATCRLLPPPLTKVIHVSTQQPQTSAKAIASISSPILQGISLQSEIGAFKKKVHDMSLSNNNDSSIYDHSSSSIIVASHPASSKYFQHDIMYEPRVQLNPRFPSDVNIRQAQSHSEAKAMKHPPYLSAVIRSTMDHSSAIEAFTAGKPPLMTVHAAEASISSASVKYPFSNYANPHDGGSVSQNAPRDTTSPREAEKERRYMTVGLGLADKNVIMHQNEAMLRHQEMGRQMATQQHPNYMPRSQFDERLYQNKQMIPQQYVLQGKEQAQRTTAELYERSAVVPNLSMNLASSVPMEVNRMILSDQNIRHSSQYESDRAKAIASQFDPHYAGGLHQRFVVSSGVDSRMPDNASMNAHAPSNAHTTLNESRIREDVYLGGRSIAVGPTLEQRMVQMPVDKGMHYQGGAMHEMPSNYASMQHQAFKVTDQRFREDANRMETLFPRASVLVEANKGAPRNGPLPGDPRQASSIDMDNRTCVQGKRVSSEEHVDQKYLRLEGVYPRYSDASIEQRYGISTGMVQRMPQHASITGRQVDVKEPPRGNEQQFSEVLNPAQFQIYAAQTFQQLDAMHGGKIASSKNTTRVKRSARNNRPSSVDSVIQKSMMITKAPSSLSLSLCDLTSASVSTPASPRLQAEVGDRSPERPKKTSTVFRPWEKSLPPLSSSSSRVDASFSMPRSEDTSRSAELLTISTDKCSSDVTHDEALMSPTFPLKDPAIDAMEGDDEEIRRDAEKTRAIGAGDLGVKGREVSDEIWRRTLPVTEYRETEQAIDQLLKISADNDDEVKDYQRQETLLKSPRSPVDSEATLSSDEAKMEIMQEDIRKYDNKTNCDDDYAAGKRLDYESQMTQNEAESTERVVVEEPIRTAFQGLLDNGDASVIKEKTAHVKYPGRVRKKSVSKGGTKREKSKKITKTKKVKKRETEIETEIEKIEEHEKEAVTDETTETTAAIDSIQLKSGESTSGDEEQMPYDMWMPSSVYECEEKSSANNESYDDTGSRMGNVDVVTTSDSNAMEDIFHPEYETISLSPPASPTRPVNSPKSTEAAETTVSSYSHSVLSLGIPVSTASHSSPPKPPQLGAVAFPYSTLSLNVTSRSPAGLGSRPSSNRSSPVAMSNVPSSPSSAVNSQRSDTVQEGTFASQNEHLRQLTEQLLRDDDSMSRTDQSASDVTIDNSSSVMTYEPLSDED
eukprot:gene14047-15508_t